MLVGCGVGGGLLRSGVAAQMSRNLVLARYPDFMENKHKPRYESEKVLGTLYRAVHLKPAFIEEMIRSSAPAKLDAALEAKWSSSLSSHRHRALAPDRRTALHGVRTGGSA